MSYLPPGWTQEKLTNATVDDLAELPYETLHLIPPLSPLSRAAQDLLFGARIDEVTRLDRIQFELPAIPPRYKPGRKQKWLEAERTNYLEDPSRDIFYTRQPSTSVSAENVDAVVQAVESAGYDQFGFTISRMNYDDDEEWEKWANAVDELVQRTVATYQGGSRIVDKVTIFTAEDREELENQDFIQALAYHHALVDEGRVSPGLQASMILVADKQAVDSLLYPTPGRKPWVWAVDIFHVYPNERQEIPPADYMTDEYQGFPRVAVEDAYTELWPLLMSTPFIPGIGLPGATGARLWNPDVDIWEGVV